MWVEKIKNNIIDKFDKFLKENTIGQLQAGWSKYADMTTSVATLKSQGYAMDKITEQLERLNYFTDETSYNFTDMVREIGKFTASGQSLEDATTAMMGIAEWAALSGKNANDASRAMYQLSQALGAGQMRLADYKSVQNLNMDTQEFRKNAIEAAIAVGTLKDNLNGTYTSLLNKKVTFSLQNFTESLTEGKWFNTEVMMRTYTKYSEAVDEIRAIVEEGEFTNAEGVRETFETTAGAIKVVKQNNKILYEKFREQDEKLTNDEIDEYLKKWKKVEKVTDETVDNFAEINKITKDQAKEELTKNYAAYLQEYAEVFKDTEKSAEEALDDWHKYVSSYGIKAFSTSQEAKTFAEAIESAKDAASTVWVGIYQDIFGDYEEAKEIWTDLANALYEIFVERLSSIKKIFDYWKTGYEKEKQEELEKLKKEYNDISAQQYLTEGDRTRLKALDQQIKAMEEKMEAGLYNGRRLLFQGLYAFGSGLKNALLYFRDAWDNLFEENETGKRLLSFSEKLRINAFQFYNLIKKLGDETDFFKNIAQGVKNLLSPLRAIWTIIKNVIGQFLPDGETAQNILVTLSEKFRDLTAKIVPSQEAMQKIARILRGIVAIIKLVIKIAIGLWKTVLEPIASAIFEVFSEIFSIVAEVLASIGDAFFNFEEGIEPIEAATKVASTLKDVLTGILGVLGQIIKQLIKLLAPLFNVVKNTIGELVTKIKSLFGGGPDGGNLLSNIAKGFQNVADRAKNAWTEGESLADVFNRFKGGTGISNFIEMLGAMLDNLVSRIGRTIAAILGLDEEIAKSKIGEGIQTAKDIIVQAFAIIKWLYTNVVRPVLKIIFQGVAEGLRDIGEAFKTGDFNKVLDTIKRVFKTLGAMEIVKLLRMITKILGAGGLLKVTRNLAAAIKQIGGYFKAKSMNERASALLKIAFALTLVVAGMTALTYLPTEKLKKLGPLLKHAGIALISMVGALALLSVATTLMRQPLNSITGFLVSMIALMLTTIGVIYLMKRAFESIFIKDEATGKVTGIDVGGLVALLVGALSPILAVAAAIGVVGLIAKKIASGGVIKDFGITIAGIGIAMAGLAFGLNQMVDFVTNVSFEEGLAAVMAMIGLIAVMTLAGIALSRFMAVNKKANWKTGLAIAIAMAAMVLSIALVVIPCLDDMVQNRDKFPQYVEALTIFAATMLAIGTSFFLMTTDTKGGFHILMAGLVFNNMTKVITKFILPLIQELQLVNLDKALPAVAAVGLFALAIGGALRLVIDGLANCIRAIAQLKAKQWVAIILSTAAAIAGIMALSHIFTEAGAELDLIGILAPMGIVIAICVAFGLFVKSISKTLGKGDKTVNNVIKVFEWMLALFTTISLGIVGILEIANFQFKNNELTMIGVMAAYIGSMLLTIIITLLTFGELVKSLAKTLGSSEQKSKNVMGALSFMMKFIMSVVAEFTLGIVAILQIGYFQYEGNESNMLKMMLVYIGSVCIGLYALCEMFARLIKSLASSLKTVKSDKFDQIVTVLKLMLGFIGTIMGGFLLTVIGVGLTYDNPLHAIVPFIGLLLGMWLGMDALKDALLQLFKGVVEFVTGMNKTQFEKFEKVLPFIKTMLILVAVMMGIVGTSITLIGVTYKGGYAWMSIISAISILLVILGALNGIVKVFKEISTVVKDVKFTQDVYKRVEVLMITMVSLVSLMSIVTMAVASSMSDRIGITLANVLIELGSILVLLWGMTKAFKEIIPLLDWGRTPDNKELVGMVIILMSMFIVIGELTGIIEKLASYDLTSWETGVAFAIAAAALMWSLGKAFERIITSYQMMVSSLAINNNQLVSLLIIFAGLSLVVMALGVLVGNMDALANVKWETALASMVGLSVVILALSLLAKALQGFVVGNMGSMFFAQAGQVALGILAISAALVAFAGAAYLIKKVFGIGESIDEGIAQGITDNAGVAIDAADDLSDDITDEITKKKNLGINSPSKTFEKFGKYIDQGLAKGITSNRKYAVNAASALATYTNEEFCDELGIASPSKVFYENGRFVVRGFINGVNSESNKAKAAGLDMADGFGQGLDNIMEDTKETFKGLWSDLGMDEDIQKAIENGTSGLAGLFENSLFGDTGEKLTEEEEKELVKLENLAKIHGANFAELYSDKYNRMIELQQKKAAAGKNKLTSGLTDSITGALGDTLGSDTLNDILDGKLGNIGSKITGFFSSSNIPFVSELTNMFGGVFTGEDGVIDQVTDEVGKKLGIDLGGSGGGITTALSNLVDDDKVIGAAEKLGNALGDALYDSIFAPRQGVITDFLDWLTGVNNYSENINAFQRWYDENAKDLGLDESTDRGKYFKNLVAGAIAEFGSEGQLDIENFEQYAETYKNLGDKWDTIKKLNLSSGFFSLGEGRGIFEFEEDEYWKKVNNEKASKEFIDAIKDNGLNLGGIITENDQELQSILENKLGESGYAYRIGTMFSDALKQNKDLIEEVRTDGLNGSEYKLTSKGNYLLKKLITNATNKDFSSNYDYGHNSTYVDAILNLFDKDTEQKISNSTGQIEEQVNKLLTGNHYETYGHFSKDQITQLITDLGYLGVLGTDKWGNYTIINPDDKINQIIGILQGITQNGLTVHYDNTTVYDPTTLDLLKKDNVTYKNLKKLNDKSKDDAVARTEFYRITGGRSFDEYMGYTQSKYDNLIKFMSTREYAAMNESQKKYYIELKDYYEKNLKTLHIEEHTGDYSEGNKENEETKNQEVIKRNRYEELKKIKSEYNINDVTQFESFLDQLKERYSYEATDIMGLFRLAINNEWIKIVKDGVQWSGIFAQDTLTTLRREFDENSPSREAIEIMEYFMRGLEIGVDENTAMVLSTIADSADLMTDETIAGLQAMANAVDDENIQPTITPIFDDVNLQNGVASVNRSFDGLNSNAQATVNSFKDTSINYTSQFDSLANGIVGTNLLLQTLCDTLQEGGLIDVNVNAEVDTNGLFDFVINKGKEKWKQTGKQQFRW